MSLRRVTNYVLRLIISCGVQACRFAPAVLLAWCATLITSVREKPDKPEVRQPAYLHQGIARRLEVAFFQLIVVPLISFLPAPLAYGLARWHGEMHYRWDRTKREQILECLKGVLGDQLSSEERHIVTRDYLRLRSCEAVDVMRMVGNGQALARFVEIRGLEHIEAALANGKGAILCGAHFGSYNCGFSLIGMKGYTVTAIGRWPSKEDRNRSVLERFFFKYLFQKPLEHHRRPNIQPRAGQFGMAVQAASVLRKNELVGVLLDSPVIAADRARATPIDFLDGQALLIPGVITLAQLTHAPVLMVSQHRTRDWRHQILEISPPLSMEGDTLTVFKGGLAVVEKAIRQQPAHWIYWELSVLIQFGLLPQDYGVSTWKCQ